MSGMWDENTTRDLGSSDVWKSVITNPEALAPQARHKTATWLAMEPEHVNAFKCGVVAALERLLRGHDLAVLLQNFALMTQEGAAGADIDWSKQAELFVAKMIPPHSKMLAAWLQDAAPTTDEDGLARPFVARLTAEEVWADGLFRKIGMPNLNDVACSNWYNEHEAEPERVEI